MADRLFRHEQMLAAFAAAMTLGLSKIRQRPASSARHVAPACFMVVDRPHADYRDIKTHVLIRFATFITVSARLSVEGSLPSDGDRINSPARRIVASVPSMASTAKHAASAITTVCPISKRDKCCATAART